MDNEYSNIKIMADEKFKTATICMMLRRPLKREEATKNALLADVLGSGTLNYPNLYEINKYMEELYGAIFQSLIVKKGEFQIIRLYIEFASVMDERLLTQAVEFLREALFNPLARNGRFSKEIFENQKNMLRDTISERINDKSSYARLKCIENMCKDEPFGIHADGYTEDLDVIDEKVLYEHYEKLIKTTPIEFIASGNIDAEKFTELVDKNFPDAGKVDVEMPKSLVQSYKSEPTRHEETLKINQSKICMGFRAECGYKGKDFYTFLVFNEVLGGSGNSKLFINVREKASLCYDIFSFLFRAKSILMIQSGVETKNVEIAIGKINEQLQAMKDAEVSDDELYMAKQSLTSGLRAITDSQGRILDFNYTQHMLGDSDSLSDIIKGIEKVTVDDIVNLANKIYADTIYILRGEKDE